MALFRHRGIEHFDADDTAQIVHDGYLHHTILIHQCDGFFSIQRMCHRARMRIHHTRDAFRQRLVTDDRAANVSIRHGPQQLSISVDHQRDACAALIDRLDSCLDRGVRPNQQVFPVHHLCLQAFGMS